ALPQHRRRPPCRRRLPPLGWRLDLGRERLVALEQVLLHAEEGERDAQQAKDHHGDPARGFFAEFLQHRSWRRGESGPVYPDWPRWTSTPWQDTKKGHRFRCPFRITGGVDGTRTRDLRRDRPAF